MHSANPGERKAGWSGTLPITSNHHRHQPVATQSTRGDTTVARRARAYLLVRGDGPPPLSELTSNSQPSVTGAGLQPISTLTAPALKLAHVQGHTRILVGCCGLS
jgi:hypothetical protein